MQNLKIKKLNPQAVTPFYATPGSNGLDFTATEVKLVPDAKGLNNCIVCHTGIAVEIPKGYVGLMFPRSSVSNKPLALANSVGVIDSDYRGEITFKFRFTGMSQVQWERHIYEAGERVGQLVLIKSEQVKVTEEGELEDTERGTGGYGSTGQ